MERQGRKRRERKRRARSLVELDMGVVNQPIRVSPDAFREYELGRQLGKGSGGTVYKAYSPPPAVPSMEYVTKRRRDEPETMVVAMDERLRLIDDTQKRNGSPPPPPVLKGKRVAIKTQPESDEFWQEVNLARIMSDLKVGPQFINAWAEDGVGFLVTEKWDMSLRDYFQLWKTRWPKETARLTPYALQKLQWMIETMHRAGYVHGDIMDKNILVRLDPQERKHIVDITLTDFGLTDTLENFKRDDDEHRNYMETLYDYYRDNAMTRTFLQDFAISLSRVRDDPQLLDWALLHYLTKQ